MTILKDLEKRYRKITKACLQARFNPAYDIVWTCFYDLKTSLSRMTNKLR